MYVGGHIVINTKRAFDNMGSCDLYLCDLPLSLSQKLLPHEQEMSYVKEALARVTVETAKKMWPQRWDSFFVDMDALSKCGVSCWFPHNK